MTSHIVQKTASHITWITVSIHLSSMTWGDSTKIYSSLPLGANHLPAYLKILNSAKLVAYWLSTTPDG
jgi:hypothetical protein